MLRKMQSVDEGEALAYTLKDHFENPVEHRHHDGSEGSSREACDTEATHDKRQSIQNQAIQNNGKEADSQEVERECEEPNERFDRCVHKIQARANNRHDIEMAELQRIRQEILGREEGDAENEPVPDDLHIV